MTTQESILRANKDGMFILVIDGRNPILAAKLRQHRNFLYEVEVDPDYIYGGDAAEDWLFQDGASRFIFA